MLEATQTASGEIVFEQSQRWEGQIVNGTYPLRQYIGGSEHSAVFLTEILTENLQKAAIKLIAANETNADIQLGRLRLSAKLSHPHLLQIFEVGSCQIDGHHVLFVVMEYADEHPYLHPAGVAGDRGAWQLASLADRVHCGSFGKNWRRSIGRGHVDRIDRRNRVSFEQHHSLHHANSSSHGAGWLSARLAGHNSQPIRNARPRNSHFAGCVLFARAISGRRSRQHLYLGAYRHLHAYAFSCMAHARQNAECSSPVPRSWR